MAFLGIIALIAGIASTLYGNAQNNSIEAQFESFLSSGTTNPGNTFVYVGIVLAIVGIVLIIASFMKKK